MTGALPNMGDRATKMLVALGSVVMATGANIVLVVIDKKQRHLLAHQNETVERQPFVASVRAFPLGYWLCLAVSVILYGLIGARDRSRSWNILYLIVIFRTATPICSNG